MAKDGRTKEQWRSTRVFGKEVTVRSAELVATPGVCAGCRRPFRDHTDEALRACAATFEDTLPEEAGT